MSLKENKDLIVLADKTLARANGYDQPWPYNVGYYNGRKLTFDCHNMFKAWFWSQGAIVDNWIVGNYAIYNPASGIDDWTTWELLQHCTDVSSDMSHILPGEYLYMDYYGDTHGGMYYGNGLVIECTIVDAWGVNGCVLSKIGPNGERSYNGIQVGRWQYHGKFPGIKYEEPQPVPQFAKDDLVMVAQNAKNYDTGEYFASWVYEKPEKVVEQTGARVVIKDEWIIGPVSAYDLTLYVPPVEEPEPWHPGTDIEDPSEPVEPFDPEPIEEPTEPIKPAPDPPTEQDENNQNEKENFWIRLLKSILEAIVSIFKKKDKEE